MMDQPKADLMTYDDCEKYIDANRGHIKSTVQFGTAFFQYFGLLIAPNTFQIDRIENIFHRCAPSGKVADDGMSNEEALIEAGEINSDLTVFVMGTINSQFVYKPFSEYLEVVSKSIIMPK
jgi:hypothetical protein